MSSYLSPQFNSFAIFSIYRVTDSHVITQQRRSDWLLVNGINLLGNSLKLIIPRFPGTFRKVSLFIFMPGLLVLLQTAWRVVHFVI